MSRVPVRHAAAPSRVIDGSAVVIQTRKAEVTTLSEVGTLLWSAIDGKRSEEELAALVCESFEVEGQQARDDVAGFLDELAGAGLLEFR